MEAHAPDSEPTTAYTVNLGGWDGSKIFLSRRHEVLSGLRQVSASGGDIFRRRCSWVNISLAVPSADAGPGGEMLRPGSVWSKDLSTNSGPPRIKMKLFWSVPPLFTPGPGPTEKKLSATRGLPGTQESDPHPSARHRSTTWAVPGISEIFKPCPRRCC